jgi:hypothetical protein
LEDLDRRFHDSTLPHHRFAPYWTPTCVLEGLSFDVPLYELPARRDDFLDIESRLAQTGIHLVVLTVSDALAQSVVSTRENRGPKWTRYLERFGLDDQERALRIGRFQDVLLQWAESSPLPLHVIETHDQDWDGYARRIIELIT